MTPSIPTFPTLLQRFFLDNDFDRAGPDM